MNLMILIIKNFNDIIFKYDNRYFYITFLTHNIKFILFFLIILINIRNCRII